MEKVGRIRAQVEVIINWISQGRKGVGAKVDKNHKQMFSNAKTDDNRGKYFLPKREKAQKLQNIQIIGWSFFKCFYKDVSRMKKN